jgi:transposase
LPEDAPQRRYLVREVFDAVPWRLLPTNFPPWPAVSQQTRCWLDTGCLEAPVHDLHLLLQLAQGRTGHPSAVNRGCLLTLTCQFGLARLVVELRGDQPYGDQDDPGGNEVGEPIAGRQ